MDERPEVQELSRGRAGELAARWVRENPEKVAVVYLEVEKPNGWHERFDGSPGRAGLLRAETVAIFKGRAYKGPKPKSTLQKYGEKAQPELLTA